jgi:hypothetical protein
MTWCVNGSQELLELINRDIQFCLEFAISFNKKFILILLQNYYYSLSKVPKSRSKNMLFFICNLIYKINNVILVIEK